jgi:hypothetical protein
MALTLDFTGRMSSVGPELQSRPEIQAAEDVRLELLETRTFGSRVIYERYDRAHHQR